MHDLIASPFLDEYLLVRPGGRGGLRLPRAKYEDLRALGTAETAPSWLADAVRAQWADLDVTGRPASDFPPRTQDAPAVEGIEALGQQPEAIRTTFPEFAEKLAGEGFVFLHSRIDSVGPVLVAVQDERVVGGIGPMETMADPIGRRRLLPQYFGVLPEYRGLGLGRLLWRSAMHWGKECGADYQLLQTAAGGASDRLCQSEGLADLGFVCTTTV
ncbi:GNAT family N-acetyltransferase [Kitasatospora sp. NPDC001132]